LTFKQTLGYALLDQIQSSQVTGKIALIEQLENTFLCLLPVRDSLRPKLAKLVDMAVDLSNDMAQEKTYFNHDLVLAGMTYDEQTMEAEETQRGTVFLCTFPYFATYVLDDQPKMVCLIKANVELESAF